MRWLNPVWGAGLPACPGALSGDPDLRKDAFLFSLARAHAAIQIKKKTPPPLLFWGRGNWPSSATGSHTSAGQIHPGQVTVENVAC